MLSRLLSIALSLLLVVNVFAQTGSIRGTVKDAATGETLIGATVRYGDGQGTVTDIDGHFSLDGLNYGTYKLVFSYVGYDSIVQTVVLDKPTKEVSTSLSSVIMKEVVVTADVAKSRETPVAFTNVTSKDISEEIGTKNLPMLLNSVPGVQATNLGGSDGDIKVTIRGFDQSNVGVLLDGVPVNDMENGAVYWSNWTGLELVTRMMQVQRGLGASKLALPSVGGTINILSKGIEAKRSFSVSQDVGSFGFSRTSLAYTSGLLKGGWGVTAAGSFRRRDGWAEQTNSLGGFYFLKVEKRIKERHLISLWGFGTPQRHGERPYYTYMPIATYNTSYANSLGITPDTYQNADGSAKLPYGINRGYAYNSYWGYLQKYTIGAGGDTIFGPREAKQVAWNNYQKPQINLKYSFNINPKLFWVTTLYASIGRGGGTKVNKNITYDEDGHVNVQRIYNDNAYGRFSINPTYSATEHMSSTYLSRQNNNHMWFGGVSNVDYQINKHLTFDGGIDVRDYRGSHFGTVADLLGGDYAIDVANSNNLDPVRKIGDVVGYNYDVQVRWAGSFAQLEFKKNQWTAFINVTGSYSGYNRIDYYDKKDLVLKDTTIRQVFSIGDTSSYVYDGVAYNYHSKEVQYAHSGWKWLPGYTVKGGGSYKINEYHSVFVNAGYLSKAPLARNVIDGSLHFLREIKNQIVEAVEAGYSVKYPKFTINVNGYFTLWKNKPTESGVSVVVNDVTYKANINGMDARHVGGEFEAAYKPIKQLQIEGVVSYADWRWLSKDTVYFLDDAGKYVLDDRGDTIKRAFDARGVHVGDAPQVQLVFGVRVEPIKGLYFKLKGSYFMKYYADFDPLVLNGANAGRESWKIPNYGTWDFYAGYTWVINKKNQLDFNGSINNLFNKRYISDAKDSDASNSLYSDGDAKSASVFFGLRINFSLGVKYTFF